MGLTLLPNTSPEKQASSSEYVSTELKVFCVNKRREMLPIGGCSIRLEKTQTGIWHVRKRRQHNPKIAQTLALILYPSDKNRE